MEDEKIVDLFLSRDEDALRYSSEKYGKRLSKIAYGIVQDIYASEECVNDTYLVAWNSIPPNKPYTYLYAFLARIVRHLSLDWCRRKTSLKRSEYLVTLSDELEECVPDKYFVEEYCDSKELMELINKYLLSIDKEKRVIFVRRYFFLDSISDISNRLLISESKVKTTLHRVRNDLKAFLNKEGYFL